MAAPEFLDLGAIFHIMELKLSLLFWVNPPMHLPRLYDSIEEMLGTPVDLIVLLYLGVTTSICGAIQVLGLGVNGVRSSGKSILN